MGEHLLIHVALHLYSVRATWVNLFLLKSDRRQSHHVNAAQLACHEYNSQLFFDDSFYHISSAYVLRFNLPMCSSLSGKYLSLSSEIFIGLTRRTWRTCIPLRCHPVCQRAALLDPLCSQAESMFNIKVPVINCRNCEVAAWAYD